jgi:L-histidine N-alpha-methyltransferase
LPPKWFYDEKGSLLFEQITELPEYYPSRTEEALLAAHAAEVAACTVPAPSSSSGRGPPARRGCC